MDRPFHAVVVLVALCSWCLPASGQVLWPFTGQGMWPDSFGRVVVTVEAHLDRILAINQDAGSWRAVHRMHLSWVDPRAQDAVITATHAWMNFSGSGSGCSLTCDASMSYEAGCCTSLWLPHIELPNLLEYNYQVTPPRWRIWVEPILLSNGTSSSKVHWTVRLDATWFSPFDFRAWPLEHQHLLVEMQPSPTLANKVQLVLGSLEQLRNTPHTKGVDIAGWWINKVTPRMFNTSACFQRSNTTSWVFDMDSASMVQPRIIGPGNVDAVLSNTTVVTSILPEDCGDIGNPEGTSQYGEYVLVIDSMVKRDKTFYVLVFIVPLIIVTLMVFVIYAMERHNLEARMGVVVTLVLALSALQFMYNFPPASYLNVVQQLTLTSYVLFGLIAVECIITSSIARIHERKRTYEATLIAAGLKSLRPSIELSKSNLTTMDSNRLGSGVLGSGVLGSGVLDFTSDDDISARSSANHPMSGLFFGSTPAPRAPDPYAFRAVMPPAVPAAAAPRQAPERVPIALTPIPEADSRGCESSSGRRDNMGSSTRPPAVGRTGGQVELEVFGPEEPHSDSGRPSPGRKGQPVGEGVEWSWPTFKRKSSAAPVERSMSDPEQALNAKPAAAAPLAAQPGKMSQIRQSFGRGRKSVEALLSNVHGRTRAIRHKMSMDEAYAQLLARRVDIIASWVLLVSYVIVIITLLAVSSSVGDHKLMLAGATAPGNMR